MDPRYLHHSPLHDRMNVLWRRGVRIATRLAIAFGLATVAAIILGAAVTDNAFAQIVVTFLAALGLWLPFAFLIARIEQLFERRPARRAQQPALQSPRSSPADERWQRLVAFAPGDAERISVLQRSLETSRLELGKAELDPDAHELCVLIDRRLPELIERELENLPPDDRNRERHLRDLVALIEQFARHCSRKRSGETGDSSYEAAVLRRRFEERLSEL